MMFNRGDDGTDLDEFERLKLEIEKFDDVLNSVKCAFLNLTETNDQIYSN